MILNRIIFLVILSVLLSACGLSRPVNLPSQTTYTISSPYVATPKSSRTKTTLLVALPVASSGYQSSKMIYVDTPYKLKEYANNRWIAPPSDMILPLLAQRIRSAGYFKAVVTPPFSGITNYHLETKLITLQQEFLQPTSLVRLVMQATLVNSTTNRVIASRRFQVMVQAPQNNPYSGVLATNKAVNVIDKRIAAFVVRSLR